MTSQVAQWEDSTCQYRRHKFDYWVRQVPGEGDGNPLQYPCLGNLVGGGVWLALVYGVSKESDMTELLNETNQRGKEYNYPYLELDLAPHFHLELVLYYLKEVNNLKIQFSSVAQSCLSLCDPMDHSTAGLPVHHQLPECTQTQCPLSL